MCGHCWDWNGKYLHADEPPKLSVFMHGNGFFTVDQIRVDTYEEVEEYCMAVSYITHPISMTN